MIIASICARGGSVGVPHKNRREILGKPLIWHAAESARHAQTIDRIVMSTDDDEIAALGRACGVEVPFMRPAELATGSASKWDVFRHLVENYELLAGAQVDVLVDIDVGTPMRTAADIDRCVRLLQETGAEVVTTVYEPDRNPYFNMVQVNETGEARVVAPSARPIVRRQDAPRVFGMTPAVFTIRRQALWSRRHWAEAKMRVVEIPRWRATDLDTPLDFEIMRFIMENRDKLNL